MEPSPPSFFRRLRDRLLPKIPDFLEILAEQSLLVSHATALLVDYMETGAASLSTRIVQEERDQDELKMKNLKILSEAFATPVDRENIYRAIIDLDEVVNYCKTTIREMEMLGVTPDQFTLELAMHVRSGAEALASGFGKLKKSPASAGDDAERARKEERNAEKAYRRALAALFQGDDYINMFKRREIYRHLSNAADKTASASFALNDIVVKMV
jgi:uncharacterized protein Yka (UPF0111/DUF47 family)